MKKNILGFILSFCLILPTTFMMSACDDDILDMAYVQFAPAVSQEVVQYSSLMYPTDAHIFLFANEEARDNNEGFGKQYLLRITFKRGLGMDSSLGALGVDIEDWSSMEIRIKKEYYYTTQDGTIPKKVYLNGEDITSKALTSTSKAPELVSTSLGDFWSEGVYYFEDFGLVKGNTSNFINKIEFK